MKKFILTFVLLISSIFLFAQDYPYISVDSCGRKTVTMTIEQAQKIDNNLEILKLLKIQTSNCDSVVSAYIVVVDEYKNKIGLLELNVETLVSKSNSMDSTFAILKKEFDNVKMSDSLCDLAMIKKDIIISDKDEEIKQLKIQRFVGFATGTAALIVSVILLLKSL